MNIQKRQKVALQPGILWPREISCLIFAYQDGIYQDMIPLGRIQRIGSMRTTYDELIEQLRHATTVLAPWMASYGASRVPLLLDCLPRMGTTLACYCVYVHDTQVRAILMTYNPDLVLHPFVFNLATATGYLETLEFFHRAGFDYNDCNIYTTISLALQSGRADVVRYCLDLFLVDASAALIRAYYWVVLFHAVTNNNVDTVRVVASGCKLQKVVQALKMAIDCNSLQVVTCLLDRIGDEMTAEFENVLNDACDNDQVELARLIFLNQDGTTRYPPSVQNKYLRRAVWFGSTGIARFLVSELNCGSLYDVDVYITAVRGHHGVLEVLRDREEPVLRSTELPDETGLVEIGCTKVLNLADVAEAVKLDVMQLVLDIVQPTIDEVREAALKVNLMPEMTQLLHSFHATVCKTLLNND
ncbi:Aste57867_8869 [Aphanomyces stellatus]|uniref:Aste57867_8869 protein n=1 Tax=Aphanomyces stellatus TaxID=120398 RepID=A0A485KLB5_9STRA|nr:hypothetical protein As57867_008834 [Aphanomyces stellatus]VFT85755.1 Aste57867_8869 [Aphanomyces stellatus]